MRKTSEMISGINQKVHEPMTKRAKKWKFAYFSHDAATRSLHRKIYML